MYKRGVLRNSIPVLDSTSSLMEWSPQCTLFSIWELTKGYVDHLWSHSPWSPKIDCDQEEEPRVLFPPTAYISVVEVPEIRVLVYLEINETYKQRVLKLYVDFLVTIQNWQWYLCWISLIQEDISTSSNQGVRDVGNLNFKGAGIFDWFVTDLVQDDSGGDLA